MLNFLLKIRQKKDNTVYTRMGNSTENAYAYYQPAQAVAGHAAQVDKLKSGQVDVLTSGRVDK